MIVCGNCGRAVNEMTKTLALIEEKRAPDAEHHSTGILPYQEIVALIRKKQILGIADIEPDQIQPASIDLRLGPVAHRVRASFLAGKNTTVQEKIEAYSEYSLDLTTGNVLERGAVYIVRLLEHLKLPYRVSARANPKSSAGRLDIFTRLITDNSAEFDQVKAGYTGPLYAEISPRTFSVHVREGTRISQLRVRQGKPRQSDAAVERLHHQEPLVDGQDEKPDISDAGIAIRIDLRGQESGDILGYKAKRDSGVINLDRRNFYDPSDFWEEIRARKSNGIILNLDDFYILASKEAITVPPDHAAEMVAYDTLVGEFRVHYAGFFDPGFGHESCGGRGSRAVLEVRPHEVPFMIEDGQIVGRLVYERLKAPPDKLYGSGIGSSYQAQGLRLSKHFRQD